MQRLFTINIVVGNQRVQDEIIDSLSTLVLSDVQNIQEAYQALDHYCSSAHSLYFAPEFDSCSITRRLIDGMIHYRPILPVLVEHDYYNHIIL